MKILIITNLFPPNSLGGAERVAELQAKGLRDAGHEVTVLTTGRPFGLRAEIVDNIKIIKFFPLNIFWYKNIIKYPFWLRIIFHLIDAVNLHGLWKTRQVINQEKPDFIISHQIKGMGMLAAIALSNEKERWVQVAHDVQWIVPSGLLRWGEKDDLKDCWLCKKWTAYCRSLINSPATVISPSDWLLRFYKSYGFFVNSRCEVLPNPAILENCSDKEPSDNFRMLYLGQVEEHKGVVWLVEQMKELYGEWELNIVGKGTALEKIKELAQDDERIKILGAKKRHEIANIFSRTDLCLLPSRVYENSPSVIYESLSCGVPVLAANIGGAGELVEEGKNGWLFRPADSNDFVRRLEKIILQKDRLFKMAENCRNSVEKYRLKNYTRRFLEIIEK